MSRIMLMDCGATIVSVNPETTDWVNRVIANGGAAPSQATQDAIDDWFTAVKAEAGLQTAIISACMFVPDSLIAALTPIVDTAGSDPWTNTGFVDGDLTVNGLVGDELTKYLDIGVLPDPDISSDSTGHMSFYVYDGNDDATADFNVSNGGVAQMNLMTSYLGDSYWDCYRETGNGRITVANSAWQGFLMGSRENDTTTNIYKANSGTGWASIVSGAANEGVRPIIAPFLFAQNTAGVALAFCDRRFSFASIGEGLTTSQGEALFDATQACRVALGGGFR